MIWRKTVSILAGFAFLTTPAWATPERVTMSEDRVFAATQSHLYVVRDIFDNLGSHYEALQDQHLVEIDLDTGEATRFWPLRHMYVNHLETGDLEVPGRVTERDGETHDVSAVLRAEGAQPIAPHAFPDTSLTLENGVLLREGEQVATNFAMRAAGRSQLGILREAYPPIETEEEYRRKERIDFYDLYAEGDWLCELQADRTTVFRPSGKISIAKIRCEDEDFSGVWSFHMLVPDDL